MLRKMSRTRALCVESFCCKSYLTPDSCYTGTARCDRLSQHHKPPAPQPRGQRGRLGQHGAVSGGRPSERLGQGQYQPRGSLMEGPGGACSHLFGAEQLGLIPCGDCLISREFMRSQLGLDGCCACVGCPLRRRQPQKCRAMVWRKKHLYYFKLSMSLENGGLNQKLKVSDAVFSLKNPTSFQSLRQEQKILTA